MTKSESQNPWQKFIDEKREKEREKKKMDAIHERFENKYLAKFVHQSPPLGVEFQATRFPVLKRDFHWCFSFEQEEKRVLKAKLLWHPLSLEGINDYLRVATSLGIEFAEDLTLRIYFQLNGDKDQALNELRRVWDQREFEEVRKDYNLGTPTDVEWWWPIEKEELLMNDEEDSGANKEVVNIDDSNSDDCELIIDLSH